MKKFTAIALMIVMLFSIAGTALAKDYQPVDPDDQGMNGIVGGDTLTFSENTVWVNLTARWGVRIIFQDGDEWGNTELQNELLPVTDGGSASTTTPEEPSHAGWRFVNWERIDTNSGTAVLNDDGSVTGINGPGPIIYKAIYVYEPEPAIFALPVTKVVTNETEETSPASASFEFVLTAVTDGAPMPEGSGATLTLPGAGTGSFGDITYTLPGTWVYSVHETPGSVSGYTYDDTVYLVTVAVTETDGVLSAVASVKDAAGNDADAVVFTNTYDVCALIVLKTVRGNAGSTTKEFAFTVTLSDTTINGTYGDMVFEDGIATFMLKDGEGKVAVLPCNIGFTVEEADYSNDGYVTSDTGGTIGTLVANEARAINFINTRNAEGSLTVAKTLAGNDTDASKEFGFTVTLSDTTIKGTYGDVTFENGVANFVLKGGETMVIEGLPNGVGYTVEEADYSSDGYVTSKTGDAGTIDEKKSAVASFTNTRDTYGDLKVSKTVSGDAGSTTKEFTFTVTLSDKTISGTYGNAVFENGVATFALKGGESMVIKGLPNGVKYTVAEVDYSSDGYVTTKTGDTGTIVGDETAAAAFTNTKNTPPPETGNLTIRKTVTGTAGDTNKLFTFTVTISASGSYNYSGSKTGTITSGGTVQLKHGETITISDLPAGTTYAVVESGNEGYEVTKTGDTGTIAANATAVAAYTNTKNNAPIETGNLAISKTVTGDLGDRSKYFSFKVDFNAAGSYSYAGSRSGTISSGGMVQLKHGESITIVGLPAGTSYSVTEGGSSGYRVYTSGDVGTVYAGKTSEAKFTNARSKVPITGDNSNTWLWIGLLAASAIGMGVCVVLFKKKKRAGKHIRTLLLLMLAGAMVFSGFGITTAFADGTETTYTYGQYDMTYLPGTTDIVTNMPVNERGLTPGSANPYTVSSTVPLRTGFEFIDWTLTWGTMEKPLTDYIVKYLDRDTYEPVADQKTVSGKEVGSTVTETAVEVSGYTALAPTEQSLELAEEGNEIIFWYEKEPVLTDYIVKYLDRDTYEPVADQKTVSGKEVGTTVTETAVDVWGYTALAPTEQSLELAEEGNEIIFWYEKEPMLTDYIVKYLDRDTYEPVAEEKTVNDVPVGTSVTEYALDIDGYTALDPIKCTLVLEESGNEIIFWYEMQLIDKHLQQPAEEKQEQPAEEKPQQPAEKKQEPPAEEKPQQPAEEKQEQPAEEKPQQPAEEKQEPSAEEKPQQPAEEKQEPPAEEKQEPPAEEKPQQPAEEKQEPSAEEKPQQPAEEKQEPPAEEKQEPPAEEKPQPPAEEKQEPQAEERAEDPTSEQQKEPAVE